MTIALLLILIAGIVAIIFAITSPGELRTSTFWFLLSFWLALIIPNATNLLH